MRAEIRPLEGKYYGTIIRVTFDGDCDYTEFTIWYPIGPPSDRWLKEYGYTRDQWERNARVPDNFEGTVSIQEELPGDDPYESRATFMLVSIIVSALNKKGRLSLNKE